MQPVAAPSERPPLALRAALPIALAWIGAVGAWSESRLRAIGIGRSVAIWSYGALWSVLLAIAVAILLVLALRPHPRARLALLVAAGLLLVYRFTQIPTVLALLGYGDHGALFAPFAGELRPLARVLAVELASDMLLAVCLVLLVLKSDVSRWLAPRA